MEFFEVFSIFVSWESLPLGYSLRLVIFAGVILFFSRFSGENSQVRGECEENTKYKSCARLVLASNHLKNKSTKKEKELPCFTR